MVLASRNDHIVSEIAIIYGIVFSIMKIGFLQIKGLIMKVLLPLAFLFLTHQCAAVVTEWIDFNLEHGHVKIPATIADIDTYAMLDTGSQLSGINKAFVAKHQLTLDKGSKRKVRGVFGVENKTTFTNVPISFLGIETTVDKITEMNLGHHSSGLLFGSSFFDKFVTQFDYPNRKMRLVSEDSIDVAKFQNIEARRQKVTGMLIVKVGLADNKHLWLILDTGNSGGVVVDRSVANKMGWLEGIESESTITMGVNSLKETESFRIPQLKFGPFELENVLVTIPAEGNNSTLTNQHYWAGSKIKGKKVQGIIGYDILKHFLITVDYKRGHAHIGLPE